MKTAALLALLAILAAPARTEPIRLTGRIEPPGAPGARVELLPQMLDYGQALRLLGGESVPPLATARPAADGTFELVAPEPGFYQVVARADGFLEMMASLEPLIEETEMSPVRLPRMEAFEMKVFGPSGEPADGIAVRADVDGSGTSFADLPEWFPAPRRAVSGAGGRLSLPKSPGEKLLVTVLSPGFLGQKIDLAAAAKPVLRLEKTPPFAIEARNAEGRPLAGVLLRCGEWPVAVTGRDGRIATGAAANGLWGLSLETADGRMAILGHQAQPGASPRTVTLSPVLSLAGRVVDARTRQPVPGALVWKQNTLGTATPTRTAGDGSFRLAVAPGGGNMLAAAAPGYVLAFQEDAAGDGQDFLLQPAALLPGRVEDAAGRPIAWARVRAFPVAQEHFSVSVFHRMEARTGRDGRFRLRGLPAGASWTLKASAEGFAPGEQMAETGEPGQSPPPVRIVLGPGTTLAGRLVDPARRPVPGAEIVLEPSPDVGRRMSWGPGEELRATSGADGRFRFAHLGAGPLDLRTEHPDFAPAARSAIQVPDRTAALDLGDLRLTPGATIEGRVTDEQGLPVAEAHVGASSFEASWSPVSGEGVTTGPDGRFRLRGLTPGQRVDVLVQHPAYVPFEAPGVEAPHAEPLDVVLRAARTLTGRVVNRAGRPIALAQVAVRDDAQISIAGGRSVSHGVSTSGRTDEEGRFVLSRLPAGLLNLQIEAPGFRKRTVEGVLIPEKEDPAPLEVVLEPGTVLEGRVLTASGAPAANLWIAAVPLPRKPGEIGSSARTDADGRYRMGELGAGRHEVLLHRGSGPLVTQKEIELTTEGTNRLDLTLPSRATVAGRIVNGEGAPVAGAELTLTGTGSPRWFEATSSVDGTFRFEDVEAGVYRLAGAARGYAPAAAPDDIQVEDQGEVRGRELRLLPGATITGRLLGLTADEMRQVRVWAVRDDGISYPRPAATLSASVDPEGLYRISSVGPGTWRVTASLSSGRQGTGTVQMGRPGEEAVLDLEIPRGITLSGRVLVDGAPLGGAEVTAVLLVDGRRTDQHRVRSRHDGSFSIAGLQPGRVTLAAVAGAIGHARQVELAADLEVTLDIATGRLSGHVFTAGGQPVEGAVVALQGEDPDLGLSFSAAQASTGETGAFEIPRMAAGSYRITVTHEGFGPVSQTVTVTPGGTAEVQAVLEAETGP
jgi:hypothetical protein